MGFSTFLGAIEAIPPGAFGARRSPPRGSAADRPPGGSQRAGAAGPHAADGGCAARCRFLGVPGNFWNRQTCIHHICDYICVIYMYRYICIDRCIDMYR